MYDIQESIVVKYEEALRGRELWLELKEKYQIDAEWYLILMPLYDKELNQKAIYYLSDFMDRKCVQNVLIIYLWGTYLPFKQNKNSEKIYIESISESRMAELITYYRLQLFFRNIVVISMDEPFGTKGIIGKCGITLDDYIKDALYV